jgi:hypothetical protein
VVLGREPGIIREATLERKVTSAEVVVQFEIPP